MGVFEHFPYANFHELNISWILRKIEELEDVIGSQIVDLVARAGVAENAQAIADLTETVETVETTATSAGTAASAAQTTANSAASAASAAQATADAATTEITNLESQIADCLITHYYNLTSGTHRITGILSGDLIITVRNALGLWVVSGTGIYPLITPNLVENVTIEYGVVTLTRTSPYSGDLIVISRSRNVAVDPSDTTSASNRVSMTDNLELDPALTTDIEPIKTETNEVENATE